MNPGLVDAAVQILNCATTLPPPVDMFIGSKAQVKVNVLLNLVCVEDGIDGKGQKELSFPKSGEIPGADRDPDNLQT